MWTGKKVFLAGSSQRPNMFVLAAAAIGGTSFTEKEAVMAITSTPAQNVETSRSSAVPLKAARLQACRHPMKNDSLLARNGPLKRGKNWLVMAAAVTLVSFEGCADSPQIAGKAREAIVCPQCKTVAVPIDEPYYVGDRASWFGRGSAAVVYRHSCPRCRGSMQSFAREGRWAHECSICKASPYTARSFIRNRRGWPGAPLRHCDATFQTNQNN